VGSRSTKNLAYIAGFLDGDGSLMFQIKRRKDGNRKWRFMCTICFYQDSRHKNSLKWIQEILNAGYMSDRKDGITELRINGFETVQSILESLLPFIRFKKIQAKAMYNAVKILSNKRFVDLDDYEILHLVDLMIEIQNRNYATKSKKSKNELLKIVGLTP